MLFRLLAMPSIRGPPVSLVSTGSEFVQCNVDAVRLGLRRLSSLPIVLGSPVTECVRLRELGSVVVPLLPRFLVPVLPVSVAQSIGRLGGLSRTCF